jgi:hypothetical protein
VGECTTLLGGDKRPEHEVEILVDLVNGPRTIILTVSELPVEKSTFKHMV